MSILTPRGCDLFQRRKRLPKDQHPGVFLEYLAMLQCQQTQGKTLRSTFPARQRQTDFKRQLQQAILKRADLQTFVHYLRSIRDAMRF
jgi:hypothetical protein